MLTDLVSKGLLGDSDRIPNKGGIQRKLFLNNTHNWGLYIKNW